MTDDPTECRVCGAPYYSRRLYCSTSCEEVGREADECAAKCRVVISLLEKRAR
ncbi:hypothetical protein [Streptosporangium sp. NPDC006007]|uniref:hypothetical protein n=1 Tax=Streptosporangium sp. NPDC006007 TaxID=3154575 RepID=UPI00339E1436